MSRRRPRRPAPTTDQRPPEVRLEAMVREPNPDRALRIFARIRQDLDANPDAAPWLAAARTLWERLVISEDSWYYFADVLTECVVYDASEHDPELTRIRDMMDDIERANGLSDDEFFRVGEGPPEWEALNDAWNRRSEAIVNAYLRDAGHADAASYRESKPAEFAARAQKGRIALWGPDELWDDGE